MLYVKRRQKKQIIRGHTLGLTGHPKENRQLCNEFYQSQILQNPIRERVFRFEKKRLMKHYKLSDEEAHYAAILEFIKSARKRTAGRNTVALQTL